jgi:hypothetical protein
VDYPELAVSTEESADGFLDSIASELTSGAAPIPGVAKGDPEPNLEVTTTVASESESLPHIEEIRSEEPQPARVDDQFMSGSPENTNFPPTHSRSNPTDLRSARPDRLANKRKLEKSADPDANHPQTQPSRTSGRMRKSARHEDYN